MKDKIGYAENIPKQNFVFPSIEFNSEDGYYDACVKIDHIAVGYFSTVDGTFTLMPLQFGDGYCNGGEIEDVKYLQDRGFNLKIVRNEEGKGRHSAYIRVSKE